mmetsp:Transcript_117870/g.340721  ORF Transcript_117870/g.340721 Transcript_117870/m.340721 type:complete len:484 (-) Transcript_117870:203-1654(-)
MHLVDHLLHLGEGVERHSHRERRQPRPGARRGTADGGAAPAPGSEEVVRLEVGAARGAAEEGRGVAAAPRNARVSDHGRRLLEERHRAVQRLAVVVLGEDGDRLRDGLRLGRPRLAALLPLLVQVVALELQVLQKLDVRGALLAGQGEILLGIGERLRVAGVLGLHLVKLLLAGLDLRLLGGREGLETLLGGELLLLRSAELGLELLQHLCEHTVDPGRPGRRSRLVQRLLVRNLQETAPTCAARRGLRDQALGELQRQVLRHPRAVDVQRLEQRLGIGAAAGEAVVGPRAERQERGGLAGAHGPLLPTSDKLLVLKRDIAEEHPHAGEHRAVELQESLRLLVLREHRDGIAEVGHDLHHVLLLSTELGGLVLAQCPRLLQGLCVRRDLLLRVCDLRGERAEARAARLDLGAELGVLRVGIGHCLLLLLLIGLAPAHHLVVHLGLLARLRVELVLHLLEEHAHPLHRALVLFRGPQLLRPLAL